jgi:alginate O-acetyltransferase complex protein AlgJ
MAAPTLEQAPVPLSPRAGTVRHRVRDVVRVSLFLAALATPLGSMILHLDRGPQLSENRRLADRPRLVLRPRELASFPGKFRYYFADHFGFRDTLIHLHGLICLRLLGVLPNPDVTRGKDDWLFLAGERSTDYYRHTDLFTQAELERWQQVLEARRAWLAARGAVYLFVVAPDKETIYGEYMPDVLSQVAPESRLDQLVAYLRTHSQVRLVDLRGVLLAAKGEERLYHKTDTHWNDRGAFRAYRAVVSAVAAAVPGVAPLPWDRFERTERDTDGMDLTRQIGIRNVFREQRLDLTAKRALLLPGGEPDEGPPIEVSQRGTNLPAVVVFHDSFFAGLVPWLAESFGAGSYAWQDQFVPEPIERIHPKVVIQEIVERKLMRLEPRNPPLPDPGSDPTR